MNLICNLIHVLFVATNGPIRCIKNWVRKGPLLRYAKIFFLWITPSVPQMGYLISILSKSPGSNIAPPTFGIMWSIVLRIYECHYVPRSRHASPCILQPGMPAFSTHHSLVKCGLTQFFVLSSKSWATPRTRLRTCKCILENWSSLGSDNGEIEVATDPKCCVELLNMVAKIWAVKLIHACCIGFELLSDTIISERHTTRGTHKNIIRRSNSGLPYA